MDFVNDLRLSLRALTRRPVYAAVSVGVLALGLAVSGTAFNFVNSYYQHIPGATAGDRVSTVYFVGTDDRWSARVSYPDFLDYAAQTDVLDGLAGLAEAAVSGILEKPGEERGDTVEWIEFQIVGLVRSIGLGQLVQPEPEVFFSLAQRGHSPAGRFLSPGFGLLVRTAAPPSWLYRTLRVHAGDLAVMNVVPMADLVAGSSGGQLSNAWYFSALALLGLALAAAGLWSVLDVAVRRRRREIGIRMSLGARRGDVAALVLRKGMWAVAVGLGCGLVLAFATTRLLESLLFGVGKLDAAAFVAGTVLLVLVAFVSVALPARRAASVDPLLCLRAE